MTEKGPVSETAPPDAIILAGGVSRRMGQNKALISLGGETLLHRAIRAVARLTNRVIVVTAPASPIPLLDYSFVHVVQDVHPGRGPLGGLHAGLLACRSPYAWAVACDMPFLNTDFLRALLDLAPGYDAVVPRAADGAHPLHAVYGRGCLDVLEVLLSQKHASLLGLLDQVRVRHVEAEELGRLDPEGLSLFNINTPQDLERARTIEQTRQLPTTRSGQGQTGLA